MKRIFSLILCAVFFCCAAASAEMAGMPNPMVQVFDDDAFEDQLHIDIDVDDLRVFDPEMYIIGGTMGQIGFQLENVNAEKVNWTLRFTRDETLDCDVEGFAGVYDEDTVQNEDLVDIPVLVDDDEKPVTVTLHSFTANTEGIDIYFWDYRGTYFCLTIDGDYSQMQFAGTCDVIMEACLDD